MGKQTNQSSRKMRLSNAIKNKQNHEDDCYSITDVGFEEKSQKGKFGDQMNIAYFLKGNVKSKQIENLTSTTPNGMKSVASTDKKTNLMKKSESATNIFSSNLENQIDKKNSLSKLPPIPNIKPSQDIVKDMYFKTDSKCQKYLTIDHGRNQMPFIFQDKNLNEGPSCEDLPNISQSSISKRLDLSSDSLSSLEDLNKVSVMPIRRLITEKFKTNNPLSISQLLKLKSKRTKKILEFIFNKNYEDPTNKGKIRQPKMFLAKINSSSAENKTKRKFKEFLSKRNTA